MRNKYSRCVWKIYTFYNVSWHENHIIFVYLKFTLLKGDKFNWMKLLHLLLKSAEIWILTCLAYVKTFSIKFKSQIENKVSDNRILVAFGLWQQRRYFIFSDHFGIQFLVVQQERYVMVQKNYSSHCFNMCS